MATTDIRRKIGKGCFWLMAIGGVLAAILFPLCSALEHRYEATRTIGRARQVDVCLTIYREAHNQRFPDSIEEAIIEAGLKDNTAFLVGGTKFVPALHYTKPASEVNDSTVVVWSDEVMWGKRVELRANREIEIVPLR